MRFRLDVHGETLVNRELERIGRRPTNAEPAFQAIAEDMLDITRSNFQSQGAARSGGWAALAESTKARKQASHDPTIRANWNRILHATEALFKSLTQRGSADALLIVQPTWMAYGSLLPYARLHQTGTSRMPQRRPVQFNEFDKRQFIQRIQRYVLTGTI